MDHHFSTKEQKLEKFACDEKQKKKLLSLICPALSSQVWKKIQNRGSAESEKKKEKSPGTPSPPKKKVQVWLFSWVKERTKNQITLCKNGSFRWRILRFTINKQKNKFYEKKRIKVSQFERQNFKDEKKNCILFCAAHSLLSQEIPQQIIIIPEKKNILFK